MCTSIVEIEPAEGMAKGAAGWFPLRRQVVAYDHARHAPMGDVIALDFMGDDGRAGVELSLASARALRSALDRAIRAAEYEEAEIRGVRLRVVAAR